MKELLKENKLLDSIKAGILECDKKLNVNTIFAKAYF